jgi:arginine metabolism regulation protein II
MVLQGIAGNERDARCYMIDAERLLRVKGLAKRDISRRCRLLHHVYSWIRIVGESTYVIHEYQNYGPVIDNMSAAHKAGRLQGSREKQTTDLQAKSGHNARLDDFLRLEPHLSDSDLDIDEIKEHEGGIHDIHLEDSRQFRGTMYHIYGISETWLSLVSQTTRLANILDASKYGKETDVRFMEFLQKRAGRLENIICSFALKDPRSDDEDNLAVSPGQRPSNNYMLRAMNSALVILFYRRIRNVNPLILQGHVDSVVQSLRGFDTAIASQNIQGPGSAWPAFIAGCEALSRRHRNFFISWLDKGFEKCGLEQFNMPRRIMKEVWERQDEPTPLLDPGSGSSSNSRPVKAASYHCTWVDVCREKNTWVILF